MAAVLLDGSGRLVELSVVPGENDPAPGPAGSPEWQRLFHAAGLEYDPAHATGGEDWIPPYAFDARVTVQGKLPDRADVPFRVEAAAYRGRPVWFRLVVDDWITGRTGNNPVPSFVLLGPLFLAPLAILLAVRNVRTGRVDWHGAICLVLFVLGTAVLAWVVGGHHSPSVLGEVAQAAAVLSKYGLYAALIGLFYVAAEPTLRRRWPWGQTAWNRLLTGRLGSPLVGRDVLVSLLLGLLVALVPLVLGPAAEALGLPPPAPRATGPPFPHGPLPPVTTALLVPLAGVGGVLFTYLPAFLLFLLFRRPWLYWPAFVVLWASMTFAAEPQATAGAQAVMIAWGVLHWGLVAAFVYRLGWLGNMVGGCCMFWMAQTPLTTDVSAWYFGWGLVGAAVVLGLGVYGFVTASGGQRLFREGFFGDE
jgi:hypothetical protein